MALTSSDFLGVKSATQRRPLKTPCTWGSKKKGGGMTEKVPYSPSQKLAKGRKVGVRWGRGYEVGGCGGGGRGERVGIEVMGDDV